MSEKSPPPPPKKKKSKVKSILEGETEIIHIQSSQKRWFVIIFMALLVIGICVLGIYSSSTSSKLKEVTAKAQQTDTTLAGCKTELQTRTEERDAIMAKKKRTEKRADNRIDNLKDRLKNSREKITDLKAEQRKAERELAQFKAFSNRFKSMVNAGKLSVTFRKGRMVVNLPAKVLFPSGSADLTEDGQKALREVAKILKRVQNKRYVIGGHTDNVKISQADFDSNWELSTARAVRVTRSLVKAGMAPSKLVAAGFSQYDPIAGNNTDAGRQKNRRIEIIVEPYLKEIPSPGKKKGKVKKAGKKGKNKAKKKGKKRGKKKRGKKKKRR